MIVCTQCDAEYYSTDDLDEVDGAFFVCPVCESDGGLVDTAEEPGK